MSFRIIVKIFFMVLGAQLSANTYYVSSSGNDANNGFSPKTSWKTIVRVNSIFPKLMPGDRILFNRGDVFYGTLTITKSGSSTSPITIGAYGSGVKPVINGFTTLTGWKNEGGHIYSASLHCGFNLNNVTIDGVQQRMGRWPNTGYRTVSSHVTNTSITDNSLTGSPDWTKAEVVIRKNRWILDRSSITSHSGITISYTSGSASNATDGFGYFIQKSLLTLDSQGEWYHDDNAGKFFMYFANDDPTSHVVNASTIQKCIYNQYFNYIIIDNLSLQGANWAAIHNYQTNHDDITNCDIKFSGAYGVYGQTDTYSNILNNTVDNCYDYGLYFDVNGHHHTIGHNIITNIGIVPGMGEPQGGHYAGINMRGINNIAEYNTLQNIGYNGISFMDSYVTVRFNVIKNYCLVKDDGAAIYTYTGAESPSTDKHILSNIIIDGIGGGAGTNTGTALTTCGIYLDDNTENVEVSGNSISNTIRGIFLHNAANCQIKNNTVYDCRDFVFRVSSDQTNLKIKNIIVTRNILFAKIATQKIFSIECNTGDDFLNWFVIDSNYYCKPIKKMDIFYSFKPFHLTRTRTLDQWQSYIKQDLNSQQITFNPGEIKFEYNETDKNIFIRLKKSMIDAKGMKYIKSLTLFPYSSIILIDDLL